MGKPPAIGENDRASPGQETGLPRVRVVWPDDAPALEQEAELIDRLFGHVIADLFKDAP